MGVVASRCLDLMSHRLSWNTSYILDGVETLQGNGRWVDNRYSTYYWIGVF